MIGHEVSKTALEQESDLQESEPWGRTPLGLETVPPDRPRAALAVVETERRWNL
jgi:hypothetical protein